MVVLAVELIASCSLIVPFFILTLGLDPSCDKRVSSQHAGLIRRFWLLLPGASIVWSLVSILAFEGVPPLILIVQSLILIAASITLVLAIRRVDARAGSSLEP